jgi:hypothetical protein
VGAQVLETNCKYRIKNKPTMLLGYETNVHFNLFCLCLLPAHESG